MTASVEILIGSQAVKEQIRAGGDYEGLRQLIRDGQGAYGMQTFDDSLLSLVTSGMITRKEAITFATSKSDLELKLSGVGQ